MAYFKDSQEVYDTLGRLLAEIMADEELGPKFKRADTVVRYEHSDPEAVITVRLKDGDGDGVDFGDSEMDSEVVMRMSADTAHRFWLGDVNVTVALARGEIKAQGPVAKILKLVPLAKPVFPRYKQQLIDQGRTDLTRDLSAADERSAWIEAVRGVAADRDLLYEEVGGINARDEPAALCPGGVNRITGELATEFWGSSCDADEREAGGLFSKAILPEAVLAKAHMPDLTRVVPAFDVESIEATPDDVLARRSSRRVQFESIEFNRRFLATVPHGHDPIALRELFSPGFLDWTTTIDREVDFGASDRQLYFLWRLRQRSRDELELALDNAGKLFRRVRGELEEHGDPTYALGPWYAGLEPFPG